MTFWNSFKELVGRIGGDGAAVGDFRADELQLAAAALLVHAAVIDGNTAQDELEKLKVLLQERFALSESEADRLIEEGKTRERMPSISTALRVSSAASSTRMAASASSRCFGRWSWRTASCMNLKIISSGASQSCSASPRATALP